jgi:hypothetical protein
VGTVVLSVIFFTVLVVLTAGYGVHRILAERRKMERYLRESSGEPPLQLSHLPRSLQKLAEDCRLLRISLDGPIRTVQEYRCGDIHRAAGEDLDAFDNMLMDVTRQLTDWVNGLDSLDDFSSKQLTARGIDTHLVRNMLDDEGWSFERRNLYRAARPPLDQRLKMIADALVRFERGLETAVREPYR